MDFNKGKLRKASLAILVIVSVIVAICLQTNDKSHDSQQAQVGAATVARDKVQDREEAAGQPPMAAIKADPLNQSKNASSGVPRQGPRNYPIESVSYPKTARSGIILGSVRDGDGDPVSRTRVSLYFSRDETNPGRFLDVHSEYWTQGDGSFRIELRDHFRGWLVIDRPQYARIADFLRIESSGVLRKAYILKNAADVLTGRVREADSGKPLSGIMISLSFFEFRPDGRSVHEVTYTDDDGRFAIQRLPVAQTVLVHASAPSHLYQFKRVRFNEEMRQKHIDFLLEPAETAGLWVSNEQGEPVAGATVRVEGMHLPAVTDESGLTRIQLRTEDRNLQVKATIVADGYLDETVTLSGRGLKVQKVVVTRGPSIFGTVIDQRGEAVPEAWLEARSGDSVKNRITHARTDEEGQFQVAYPQPPLRSLLVSHPDHLSRRLDFDAQDVPAELRVVLEDGSAGIFGVVVNSQGAPVPTFRVWFNRRKTTAHPSGTIGRLFSDPEGRFFLTGLPEGKYNVQVRDASVETPLAEQGSVGPVELTRGQAYGELVVRLQAAARKGGQE